MFYGAISGGFVFGRVVRVGEGEVGCLVVKELILDYFFGGAGIGEWWIAVGNGECI